MFATNPSPIQGAQICALRPVEAACTIEFSLTSPATAPAKTADAARLWVQRTAKGAAEAASLLRADDRIGLIRKGREARMVLVNGNPLRDIRDTENIVSVFFKGERIERPDLFAQD